MVFPAASQDALVTFNGLYSRALGSRTNELHTSFGITYAASSHMAEASLTSTASSPPSAAVPTATSSAALPATTLDPTSQHTLDFARTAVLYILEKSFELHAAVSAQNVLQTYFSELNEADPGQLGLGGGWFADLLHSTISNGTSSGVSGYNQAPRNKY